MAAVASSSVANPRNMAFTRASFAGSSSMLSCLHSSAKARSPRWQQYWASTRYASLAAVLLDSSVSTKSTKYDTPLWLRKVRPLFMVMAFTLFAFFAWARHCPFLYQVFVVSTDASSQKCRGRALWLSRAGARARQGGVGDEVSSYSLGIAFAHHVGSAGPTLGGGSNCGFSTSRRSVGR